MLMIRRLFLACFWLLSVSAVLGRPILLWRRAGSGPGSSSSPPEPPLVVGSYVGVRPKAYEGVNKYNAGAPPHPAILLQTGQEYQVAIISSRHPHDPPQVPLSSLHPDAGISGNINLHAKTIAPESAKPWKGAITPMPHNSVKQLIRLVNSTPPPAVPPNVNAPLGGNARPRGFNKKTNNGGGGQGGVYGHATTVSGPYQHQGHSSSTFHPHPHGPYLHGHSPSTSGPHPHGPYPHGHPAPVSGPYPHHQSSSTSRGPYHPPRDANIHPNGSPHPHGSANSGPKPKGKPWNQRPRVNTVGG